MITPQTNTGLNFSSVLGAMAAPFRSLRARISSINFSALIPLAHVALLIVSFITLLGGLFAFLPLPLMGAAGIVAFTNLMFALPPVGFFVMVVSLVVIFRLLPASALAPAPQLLPAPDS